MGKKKLLEAETWKGVLNLMFCDRCGLGLLALHSCWNFSILMPLSSWGHRQPFLQISHRPGQVLHTEPRAPRGQGRRATWSPTCPWLWGCSSSGRAWVEAPAPESPAHGQPPPLPPSRGPRGSPFHVV